VSPHIESTLLISELAGKARNHTVFDANDTNWLIDWLLAVQLAELDGRRGYDQELARLRHQAAYDASEDVSNDDDDDDEPLLLRGKATRTPIRDTVAQRRGKPHPTLLGLMATYRGMGRRGPIEGVADGAGADDAARAASAENAARALCRSDAATAAACDVAAAETRAVTASRRPRLSAKRFRRIAIAVAPQLLRRSSPNTRGSGVPQCAKNNGFIIFRYDDAEDDAPCVEQPVPLIFQRQWMPFNSRRKSGERRSRRKRVLAENAARAEADATAARGALAEKYRDLARWIAGHGDSTKPPVSGAGGVMASAERARQGAVVPPINIAPRLQQLRNARTARTQSSASAATVAAVVSERAAAAPSRAPLGVGGSTAGGCMLTDTTTWSPTDVARYDSSKQATDVLLLRPPAPGETPFVQRRCCAVHMGWLP
jgi:hypothetical protein